MLLKNGMLKTRAAAPVTALVLVVSSAFAASAIAGGNDNSNARPASADSAAAALTKKQVKKIAKKVAKKQIKKAAPTLTVAKAGTADTATTAQNANLLNGYAANELSRLTSASAGDLDDPCSSPVLNDFTSGDYTDLLSRQVTAPKAGILLLTVTVSTEVDSSIPGDGRFLMRALVDGAQAGAAAEVALDDGVDTSCGDSQTTTFQVVVPVSAGTHTVGAQIRRYTGTGGAWVGGAHITSLYVPFGNAGVPAVPAGADNN